MFCAREHKVDMHEKGVDLELIVTQLTDGMYSAGPSPSFLHH